MLLFRTKAHDIFHTRPVVPTAIEDDDFTRSGEMRDVSLHIHLSLLTIRGGGKGDHAKYTRVDPLGDCPDRATLPGTVAAFEHDNHAQTFVLDPFLKLAKLRLEPAQLLLVFFAIQIWLGCSARFLIFRKLASR